VLSATIIKFSTWSIAVCVAVLSLVFFWAAFQPGPFVSEGGPSDAAIWLWVISTFVGFVVLVATPISTWLLFKNSALRTKNNVIAAAIGIALVFLIAIPMLRQQGIL
jgi:hypothetical protein